MIAPYCEKDELNPKHAFIHPEWIRNDDTSRCRKLNAKHPLVDS